MDDIVKKAMAKWPNVPACYGWLGLDGRGNWCLRDDQAQAAGPFAGSQPGAKGSRVQHAQLAAFISRNYLCDSCGCWYFQNGPQQVFVELEYAPWIWRLHMQASELRIHSHTGLALALQTVQQVLVDEYGAVFLATPVGLGLVHTQDMHDLAAALEQTLLPAPSDVRRAALPACYGFVLSPQARVNTKSQ